MLKVLKDPGVKTYNTIVEYKISVTIEHPEDISSIDIARLFQKESRCSIDYQKKFDNGEAKVVKIVVGEIKNIGSGDK